MTEIPGKSTKSRMLKFILLAFGVVFLDQSIKMIIKLNMELGGEVHLLGDVFKLHFTENKGAAFGLTFANLFSSLSESNAKVILSVFSFFALFLIIYFLWRSSQFKSALPWFVALILGGATGNIIDRMFYGMWFARINDYEGGFMYGRVVDMFYFDLGFHFIPNWVPFLGGKGYQLWPIFNIADVAIAFGILTILVFQGKFYQTHLRNSGLDKHGKPIEREEIKKPSEPSSESSGTGI